MKVIVVLRGLKVENHGALAARFLATRLAFSWSASSSSYSDGWVSLKTPAATAPAKISTSEYTRHGQNPPPLMMCELEIPIETAGLSEPPEILPMAQPPTVTHIPMAKPKYSDKEFLTVATESTTKARTKVNT